MRLSDGQVWAMPILLDLSEKEREGNSNESFSISNESRDVFIMYNSQYFEADRNLAAKLLYGTSDLEHPGVYRFMNLTKYFVSGELKKISNREYKVKKINYKTPDQIKEIFKNNGWRNIVSFQTRNPPHRSHEFIQKKSLAEVDGLLVYPIIGEKKKGDIKDEFILGAYAILIDNYYDSKSVELATFHTYMRYAGPRDAVFHALVRRNFGCTHMIIGRDHTGVGNYYGSYDAQNQFDKFSEEELGIKILKHNNVAYCKKCFDMVPDGDCVHSNDDKVHLSGTELRSKLEKNEDIPNTFMRSEVVNYLRENNDIFVK